MGPPRARFVNLLITNTQEEQAYLILRCLRHVADRIVITVSEGSLLTRWSGVAAWSRHVHRRYSVPDCTADWRAGRIQAENSPAEESYIRRIEEICTREAIDVIFPSYDAEVLVFAKNKARLAAQGILPIVPEFAALTRVIDKELTLRGAQAAGFPIPESCVPASEEELLEAASRITGPWVLKPRCNAHGANIKFARDRDELRAAYARLVAIQPRPILQEYVPIRTKRNFYLVVAPDFSVVAAHSPRVLRHRTIGIRTPCAVVETAEDLPLRNEVTALVRELGIWGGMTLQTIVDDRDGMPRLLEVNPRFGHNVWYRTELGINEPLIYLDLARGRSVGMVPTWPSGVLLLDPLWDLLQLFLLAFDETREGVRRRLGHGHPVDRAADRESVGQLLRSLRSEYFGPARRVTNPLNRGFLSDPLPALARIGRTVLFEMIRRWQLSRSAKMMEPPSPQQL